MADVQPTMTDADVMRFISDGYVALEAVVDDEFNRRCDDLPGGGSNDFIQSDETLQEVLMLPVVAGVARSLLGEGFEMPAIGHHHLYEAPHVGQTWHTDGLSGDGYDVTTLQCFYYPQHVDIEDGPTMILPGSHHRTIDREAIAHYGDIRGQKSLTVPAGTVVLTRFGLWHKAGPKINTRRRGMVKWSFRRTAKPRRDWLIESDEAPKYANRGREGYHTEVEAYREWRRRSHTWEWMCGLDPVVTPPVAGSRAKHERLC
jgi:hypothetical protein